MHGAKAAPSTEHSNVAPASLTNVKSDVPDWTGSTAAGGWVSIVMCRSGDVAVLPAASDATAVTACEPSARFVVSNVHSSPVTTASPSFVAPSKIATFVPAAVVPVASSRATTAPSGGVVITGAGGATVSTTIVAVFVVDAFGVGRGHPQRVRAVDEVDERERRCTARAFRQGGRQGMCARSRSGPPPAS